MIRGLLKPVRKLFAVLAIIKFIPHLVLFSKNSSRDIIEKDISRWIDCTNSDVKRNTNWEKLIFFISQFPEFRNLFYYRVQSDLYLGFGTLLSLAQFFYKPVDTLYIWCPLIGSGLFIQHGFSTVIAGKSIGENCWVNQQVTIGYSNDTDYPVIGNNVRITAGAKVIGAVTIGDNSIVGANAVVTKNVPSNCTVVGIPAYIIKREGKKTKEAL
ncbi:hypothetical protein NIES2101_35040 [Calothrix sp. HK-06]|nr:hypothetical protein NIES2101_35040 [Calothrix sp. HK-06]